MSRKGNPCGAPALTCANASLEHRNVERAEAPAIMAVNELHIYTIIHAGDLCNRNLPAL